MDNQNSNNTPLGDLFSSIKCYIDLRMDEIKLALAENLAKIFSRIIFFFLLFILIGVVLGIVASALASWLTELVGNHTAGLLHQALQSVHRLTSGYNIVHNEDALALDLRAVVLPQEQVLLAQGGDGADGHVDGVGHVDLGPLPGDEVLLRP